MTILFKELLLKNLFSKTHMTAANNKDKSGKEEPIMCSKCNMVFESDSDYIQHYNEKHKPTEEARK